jgi:alpha-ketoglutarate-dependent taurine dioxygenase
VTYGDGSPIDDEDLKAATDIAYELTFDLNWQAGDVALIDNARVMHGRRPFQGSRSVLASLCTNAASD